MPLVASGQMVNTIVLDSHEELEYLFQSGQIDAEQYRVLDELLNSMPVTQRYFHDDLMRSVRQQNEFLEIDLEDTIEVEAAEDHQDGWLTGFDSRVKFRLYHDLDQKSPYREYFSYSGNSEQNLSLYIEAERHENWNDYYLRRRHLDFRRNRFKISAGNFAPDWGMDVSLGYPADILHKSDDPLYQSVLFPSRGRYNGLMISHSSNYNPTILFSYDRSRSNRSRLAAGMFDYGNQDFHGGLLVGIFRLDDPGAGNQFDSYITSGYLALTRGKTSFESEFSLIDIKYPAFNAELSSRYERAGIRIMAWNYHRGYVNPYGSGRANPDSRRIYIDSNELNYTSRHNGEYGLLLRTDIYDMHGHNPQIMANYWRDGIEEEKVRIRMVDRYAISSRIDAMLTYLWGNDNLDDAGYGDRQHIRVDLNYKPARRLRFRISAEARRVYYSYGRRDYLRGEARFAFPIDDDISVWFRFSRIDNDLADGSRGYWLIYLGENMALGDSFYLRVSMSTREGIKYNMIKSARLNLQIIWTTR